MSNRTLPNYEFGGPNPRHFGYSKECPLNEEAFLIPENSGVEWEIKPMSPATVRHLYSPIPLNYEDMYMYIPKGTLYDHNFSKSVGSTGMGVNKKIGGHYITWPLTNEHVLEQRDYTSHYFKRPGPISSNTYNYTYQVQPNHFRTDGW